MLVVPILRRLRQADCYVFEASLYSTDPLSKEKGSEEKKRKEIKKREREKKKEKEKNPGSGKVNSKQENTFTASEDSCQCATRIVKVQLILKYGL